MNIFKKLVLVLSLVIMSSCGASFQISTMNHDPIYDSNGNVVEVIENEMQLDRKLRNDFNFRYDYAQYAKSQPISFDWNNRILRNNRFNRFNFNNRYGWNNTWNYSSYWNRDQMWDDWLWGYSSMNYGTGWSYSWRNNSWNSNSWNSPYGWNNYYGWGNGYDNVYGRNSVYGRRLQTYRNLSNTNRRIVQQRNGRAHSSMIESTKRTTKPRRVIRTNIAPINNNSTIPRRVIRTKPVRNNTRTITPTRTRSTVPTRTRSTVPTRTRSTVPTRTRSTKKDN